MNELTLKEAYTTIHSNGVIQGTISLVIIIALCIMIFKIVKMYDTAKIDSKEGSIKIIFDLIKQLGKYMVFIAFFPFALYFIETILAPMQDEISSHFNSSLNIAGNNFEMTTINEYINKEALGENPEEVSVAGDPNIFTMIYAILSIKPMIYLSCMYIIRYIYFFFCCGRYLWLLMLEIVAPIAIICSLSDKTFSIFSSWLKYMVICYLLLPFYLMTEVFSELILKIIFEEMNMDAYGIFAMIGMIVIKISLFGVVTKRTLNLI